MDSKPDQTASPSLTELLDEALRLAGELDKSLSKLFPESARAMGSQETLSLDGLSVEEKLVRGIEAARRLSGMAFHAAPGPVLDSLEERLPAHVASRDEAAALLERLQPGKK